MRRRLRKEHPVFLALLAVLALAGGATLASGGSDHRPIRSMGPITSEKPTRVEINRAALAGLPPLRLPKGPLRVLFLGDSLRTGYGASTEQRGYEKRVLRALARKHKVTFEDGARQTDGLTFTRSFPKVPKAGDLAVIELGTNDYKQTPLEDFAADYRALIAHLRATGTKRFLCLSVWRPANERDVPLYNDTIAEACPDQGGRFVDIASLHSEQAVGPKDRPTWKGPGDDFHPNDLGHDYIATAVLAALDY